jgi:hypothetical protein
MPSRFDDLWMSRSRIVALLSGVAVVQADVNVSLTAVSQLWNAADFLAHSHPTTTNEDGPAEVQSAVVMDNARYEELLQVCAWHSQTGGTFLY